MTVNDQDKWRDDTDRPREDYPQTISARAAYGGIKWGSAFFGWLSAMGLAVLLTALLAAVGAAVGVSKGATVDQAAAQASENVQTVGIAGGIGLAVILFISYFCGGYVAGRMARFSGMRQGLAVWIWAVVIAVLVAAVAAAAGAKYDVLERAGQLPADPGQAGRPHHRRSRGPGRHAGGDPRRGHARWRLRHALPPARRPRGVCGLSSRLGLRPAGLGLAVSRPSRACRGAGIGSSRDPRTLHRLRGRRRGGQVHPGDAAARRPVPRGAPGHGDTPARGHAAGSADPRSRAPR